MGCFPIKDMQTTPPSPLKNGHFYIKGAQCAETNEEVTKEAQQFFCSKMAKFKEKIRIGPDFVQKFFFVLFLVFEI